MEGTPIKKKPTAQVPSEPSAQFASMPGDEGNKPIIQEPVPVPMPTGSGQGMSKPDFFKKEFFGLGQIDYPLIAVVFAIVLLATSSFFLGSLRKIPSAVDINGLPNMVTTTIIAIICAMLYFLALVLKNKY